MSKWLENNLPVSLAREFYTCVLAHRFNRPLANSSKTEKIIKYVLSKYGLFLFKYCHYHCHYHYHYRYRYYYCYDDDDDYNFFFCGGGGGGFQNRL